MKTEVANSKEILFVKKKSLIFTCFQGDKNKQGANRNRQGGIHSPPPHFPTLPSMLKMTNLVLCSPTPPPLSPPQLSDIDFNDSIMTLGFEEATRSTLCEVYLAHRRDIRDILGEVWLSFFFWLKRTLLFLHGLGCIVTS